MSRWRERYEPILAELDKWDTEIQLLSSISTSDEMREMTRLRRVASVVRKRVQTADPEMVSHTAISGLVSQVQSATSAITAQRQAKEAGQAPNFQAPNEAADNLLDHANAYWPNQKGQSPSVREALESVQTEATEWITSLGSQVEGIAEQLAKLEASGAEALTERDTAIAALDQRLDDVKTAIEQQVTRLTDALTTQSTRFEEAQEKRLEDFATFLNDQTSDAKSRVGNWQKQANEGMSALADQQKKAEDIVGTIARTGMAGGYQQYSASEAKTANILRAITLGLGVAVVVILAWGTSIVARGDVSPESLSVKLALSVALGGLAAYAARQSAHHRANL